MFNFTKEDVLSMVVLENGSVENISEKEIEELMKRFDLGKEELYKELENASYTLMNPNG